MTRARIDRLAYIGWRGIHGCEVLDLDAGPMTGLIGPSGAGKTTLVMCLDYALLPDRKVLDIKPISDIKDSQKSGIDTLSSRINPKYGYAYVALDISTRMETRLIAGIFVQSVDGSADFTRWVIKNAPLDMPLQDILSIAEGDNEYHPEYPELKRHLASKGIDVVTCRSVGEYGQALYEAGVLPANMSNGSDRTLYANLIETTFKGGISQEVAGHLKEYLLPEAAQIPEIVRGLEECTNELIKTRSAVRDANKELDLLRATYGVGKEITSHSIRWMLHDIDRLSASVASLTSQHVNAAAELDMVTQSIPQIADEMNLVAESKKTAIENAHFALNEVRGREAELTQTIPRLDASLGQALNNKKLYDKCRKLWVDIVEKNNLPDFESAIAWLDEQVAQKNKEIAVLDIKTEALQKERDRLVAGRASQASELLAERMGGTSLEQALTDVDETDALAIEMNMHGLAEGVIGVDIDALPKLSASNDLPNLFWMGKKAPTAIDVHHVGDWLLGATSGGYVVARKDLHPAFGGAARIKRRHAIQVEMDALTRQRSDLKSKTNSIDAQRINLQSNKDGIAFFLSKKNDVHGMEEAVEVAQGALDEAKAQLQIARTNREDKEKAFHDTQLPYDKQLSSLQLDLNAKSQRKEQLNIVVKECASKLAVESGLLQGTHEDVESAKHILGTEFESMLYAAKGIVDFGIGGLVNAQAKRIAKLSHELAHEAPARLVKLQDVNAEDRVSTLYIWPVLMEIVRERIDTDLADADGVDLIQAMQERRANLDGELVKQENEVKIKARNISAAIRANIQTQKKKIEKLSEFGKHIQFGNVVGIQLKLSPCLDMLAILDEFAQQTSLFNDQRKVDEVLRDLFKESLVRKIDMSGEALLDYRNYVDLVIEAKRKGRDWEPAASLSGGESIGCGLAIALMLTRSIAAKGEIKVDQIAPLFAVDEVQRLDPEGQTMLVDFAKREGFQILVTATTLEPGFKCTLYALNRVYDPDERLVVRGVKVKRDAVRNFKVVK